MKKYIILLFTITLMIFFTSCSKLKKVNLSYEESKIEIYVGDEISVKPNVELGKKVKDYKLTYDLSSRIAKVDNDGNLVAKEAGKVTLTVTANDKDQTSAILEIEILDKEYETTLNLDGGVLDVTSISYKNDEVVELPVPTKEGYTFLGWYEEDEIVEEVSGKDYSLVAKWEANEYTITLNTNGGVLENRSVTCKYDEKVTLPIPTKDGYAFLGWYIDDVKVNSEYLCLGNVSLEAKWEIIDYTVSLDANGGVVESETITFEHDNIPTLPVPTKDGHVFLGWYEGEIHVEVLENKNYSLVAKWQANKYTVSLDANGGVVESETITFEHGNTPALPVPTKEGYDFVGWYEEEVLVATLENKNYSLVAKWQLKEYTITFDVDGGNLDITSLVFKHGEHETIQLPIPTKYKHMFVGWFENDVLVEKVENKDYNLKAHWEERTNFSIELNPNGGEVENTTITFEFDQFPTLPIPTRVGYNFVGWFEGSKQIETLENKDYNLKARWELIYYTLTYDLDGGTLSSNAFYEIGHGKDKTLVSPTKENYKFLGWSLEKGSTEYISSKIKGSQDLSLYANWQQVKFTINYIYEDGELPTKQATSVEEVDAEFWPAFAAWYGYTGDIATFRSTVLAKWATGSEGGYKLYKGGSAGAVDENYFIHDPKTDPMWVDWLNNVEMMVQNINKEQSIWTSTYAGYMRIGQFFNKHSNWTETRSEYVYSKFYAQIPLVTNYELGDEKTLVELVIDDGRTFLGWYDEEGNRVTQITADMAKDLTLTAKWSASTPADSFTLDKVTELAKFDSYQLTWTLLPENTTNKRITFNVSDTSILTIEDGLMYGHEVGKVTVEVIVHANEALNFKFDVEVYVNPYIDVNFENSSIVTVDNTIQIDATLQYKTDTISWKSLDPNIATVDESGKVKGISSGYARIVAYATSDEEVALTLGVTVVSQEEVDLLSTILDAHNAEVHYNKKINVAYDYDTSVIGSVSDLLFNYNYSVNDDYYIKPEETNGRGYMSSIEFITVHYSGMPLAHQDGEVIANALYTAYNADNWGGTSWHYSTGNDGIFHSMNEKVIGWHAGDGTGVKFQWNPTGVMYDESDPQWPTWGISSNAKFTINGKETTIKVPYKEQRGNEGYVTSDKWLNDQGFAFKIVNGEYYMGNTWWCYSNVWEGRICSKGGNLNSIGIESACNYGSDLWYTYQITSQLVARLLIKYNLDITRVVGHHFFAAKDCPQPLLLNDGELWDKFIECVIAEHNLLTKLQDYTITCVSNNPDLVNDHGRVLNVPNYTTPVSYTLTIKNNVTGVTNTLTLSSVIHGEYSL